LKSWYEEMVILFKDLVKQKRPVQLFSSASGPVIRTLHS